MKRASKIAVAVGLALGLGTAVVVAHPGGWGGPGMMGWGGGYGPMHGYGPGMMGGGYGPGMMHGWGGGYGPGMMGWGGGYNVEDRLAAQKSALKITPEQEKAWSAYADVAKKQFEAARAQHEAMWKSAPASSAERYELHSKFMAERVKSHEAVSDAYKQLYSSLTPEQRTIADQGGGYGPRGPGGRWR